MQLDIVQLTASPSDALCFLSNESWILSHDIAELLHGRAAVHSAVDVVEYLDGVCLAPLFQEGDNQISHSLGSPCSDEK
jgi:hypothetical protein